MKYTISTCHLSAVGHEGSLLSFSNLQSSLTIMSLTSRVSWVLQQLSYCSFTDHYIIIAHTFSRLSGAKATVNYTAIARTNK